MFRFWLFLQLLLENLFDFTRNSRSGLLILFSLHEKFDIMQYYLSKALHGHFLLNISIISVRGDKKNTKDIKNISYPHNNATNAHGHLCYADMGFGLFFPNWSSAAAAAEWNWKGRAWPKHDPTYLPPDQLTPAHTMPMGHSDWGLCKKYCTTILL